MSRLTVRGLATYSSLSEGLTTRRMKVRPSMKRAFCAYIRGCTLRCQELSLDQLVDVYKAAYLWHHKREAPKPYLGWRGVMCDNLQGALYVVGVDEGVERLVVDDQKLRFYLDTGLDWNDLTPYTTWTVKLEE